MIPADAISHSLQTNDN